MKRLDLQENMWFIVAVVVGAILVICGLINYIRAFLDVKNGVTHGGRTSPQTPKPAPVKPVKMKGKRVFPAPLLWLGILLSFLPFVLRFLDLVYDFRLSDYLPLDLIWGGYMDSLVEYHFQMFIFVLNAVLATIFLFVAFYRQKQRSGWSFGKSATVWLFTYGIATTILFHVCASVGEETLGSADSGPMIYVWIVYLYLGLWIVVDKIKNK